MVPVKLSIKHWELGPADIGFSIGIIPVSLEEALDERRLKLTLDSQVCGVKLGVGCKARCEARCGPCEAGCTA